MDILGFVLGALGVLFLAGLLLQFPFFYNNPKAKVFIKMMGKRGYDILIAVFGVGFIVAAILLNL